MSEIKIGRVTLRIDGDKIYYKWDDEKYYSSPYKTLKESIHFFKNHPTNKKQKKGG